MMEIDSTLNMTFSFRNNITGYAQAERIINATDNKYDGE